MDRYEKIGKKLAEDLYCCEESREDGNPDSGKVIAQALREAAADAYEDAAEIGINLTPEKCRARAVALRSSPKPAREEGA